MFCENCEALGETCCTASKARRQTAITLAGIIDRQGKTIALLREALEAQRELMREVMEKNAI